MTRNGNPTKAGCALALLLFARGAVAQTATPEAPATEAEAPAPPAAPPKISYVGGQLKIDALGSTLADVLTQVAALTGVKIDVPASAASERMAFVELGPGPARQILASLLSDSNFDYLIQASDADPEKIQSVLLLPREKKGSGPNRTEVAARGFRGPAAPPEAAAPEDSVEPQPEVAAPEASALTPAPVAMPADQIALPPSLQPDPSAKPGALTPPTSLSPASINQQLQQMYQQRVQMTQQDHYTGSQPTAAIPGVK
jgi:hypothetical protein